ncbi:MAG: family 20 glycosylhydrolase [Akkermansiaceae bacterium]
MKFFVFLIALALPLYAVSLSIVPLPKLVEPKTGDFVLTEEARIVCDLRDQPGIEASLKPLGEVLSSELELLTGMKLKVVTGEPQAQDIVLRFSDPIGEFAAREVDQIQGYNLEVSRFQVVVSAQYYKGVAYGTASLLQLLDGAKIPAVLIKDEPTSEYRAVMLDVARQVHSLEVVKDVIRMGRLYKMRYVHLHLTDDQIFTFPFEPITANLKGNFTYSREELLELVAYADARGVTLIPEFDLPGHSSKLKASGYLGDIKSDYDVAAPENYEKIGAIVSDMMEVFASSPYFHIGGDESGAGKRLIPFLQAMNKHVRRAGRRLMVWEGFHGAPIKELPATGDDHIIVLAWESTYNAPWNLLEAGYKLINASWRPLYVVGTGNPIHPGSSSGRKFSAEEIYHWDKNTFMHWEPGRPVYEDRGPKDPTKGDHEWSATLIGKEDQIIGGQLLFWEQTQETVMIELKGRLAPLAERLWNPKKDELFASFEKRSAVVWERISPIVQPIKIELTSSMSEASPMDTIYQGYLGETTKVQLMNRSAIKGEIKFVDCPFSNNFTWIDFRNPIKLTTMGEVYEEPVERSGGFGIRAQLFREDGSPVEGKTWSFFNNWEPRVSVTEYDIGGKTLPKVFDMAELPEEKVISKYKLPMLRGPLRNTFIRGQKFESILTAPGAGDFEISMKSQSGHATLFLDVNQNGKWEKEEILIADTPNTEIPQVVKVKLKEGAQYRLRVDHNSGLPRPVVIVTLLGGSLEKKVDISEFLSLPR